MSNNSEVSLLNITRDYMRILKTAIGKCHNKAVGDGAVQHCIKSRHHSVLEHCMASFEVECSIAVLGQITRHRHLSFTVQGTRVTEVNDSVIPPSILESDFGGEFASHMIVSMSNYNSALFDGMEPQDAAYLLPRGAKTRMVVSGNFRAWLEYLYKRTCRRAMPEHRKIAKSIQSILAKEAPEIFDREFPNCAKCTESSCEFK